VVSVSPTFSATDPACSPTATTTRFTRATGDVFFFDDERFREALLRLREDFLAVPPRLDDFRALDPRDADFRLEEAPLDDFRPLFERADDFRLPDLLPAFLPDLPRDDFFDAAMADLP
jgi:hypothetical protein